MSMEEKSETHIADVEMLDADTIPTEEYEFGIEGKKSKWILYEILPYPISSKIMAVFLNAAYRLGAKFSPQLIKTLLDEIVVSVCVKPKIDHEFVKSAKCPTEFVGVALSHFAVLMSSFQQMTGLLPTDLAEESVEEEEMNNKIM